MSGCTRIISTPYEYSYVQYIKNFALREADQESCFVEVDVRLFRKYLFSERQCTKYCARTRIYHLT